VTVVAARLDHRDTSTTLKVYGHLMPGADTRAASVVGSAFRRRSKEGLADNAHDEDPPAT
jgi:hypothetical protein